MKILVIGHSVEDHIIYSGKSENVKPGGIFYSTAALNFFKEPEDEIYLATSVEKSNYNLFEFVYEEVNRQYFQYVDAIPKVYLHVSGNKERHEKYENITDKLKLDFSELNKYDGILVNMITGFDIDVNDIIKLRNNYTGLIYFDVHTLSRGLGENYVRNFRKIPLFDKWASSVDIIQANKNEIYTLSSLKNENEIIEEIFSYGVQIFIITRGNSGASVYYKNDDKIILFFEPAIKINAVNKIGCGDVFGAVFFYSYIKNKNLKNAVTLAGIAGGCVSTYSEIIKLKDLRKDVLSRCN